MSGSRAAPALLERSSEVPPRRETFLLRQHRQSRRLEGAEHRIQDPTPAQPPRVNSKFRRDRSVLSFGNTASRGGSLTLPTIQDLTPESTREQRGRMTPGTPTALSPAPFTWLIYPRGEEWPYHQRLSTKRVTGMRRLDQRAHNRATRPHRKLLHRHRQRMIGAILHS